MSDRRTIAIALRERGTDFALLREWSDNRLQSLLQEFCAIESSDHGKLAAAQGHIREVMNLRNLEKIVAHEAELPAEK